VFRAGARRAPRIEETAGIPLQAPATQRIVKIRRDYNTWVANETLEDYALRFTPRAFRKWSEFRVANTAIGAVSFLALEAIGGAIAIAYGFTNAFWAIAVVSLIIFLTGLPISSWAAKSGLDMDLLTRGAGFGYIGSTITSLIYASFTFIFFALEAAIMALALELYFRIPLSLGYLLCSLVVIPLVTHGITLISRLQLWTQPLWLVLLVLPYAFVLWKDPQVFADFTSFGGRAENGASFDWLLFGSAATIAFSLVAQIGEQVDFLRFLPEKTRDNRVRWWTALVSAGPGWILLGAAKMLGGAFLAFLALQHEVSMAKASEPTQMYLVGFRYVFDNPGVALAATMLFVLVSQVKINVTNAYAGSLAWSNFFARVTHSHPGRVVWLVFNVLIAVVLMELGVFKALEHVLGLYSNVAIAWIGALVADLVVNKPLGLSPRRIEFKRAYLYDVNPVGVGSMLIASALSIAAFTGAFGPAAAAFSSFIALIAAFVTAPLIAWGTRGRYYMAREPEAFLAGAPSHRCVVCENTFEREDMAHCPAYAGTICSLCCSLDARCHDRCKENSRLSDQFVCVLERWLPRPVSHQMRSRLGHFAGLLLLFLGVVASILTLIYFQEALVLAEAGQDIGPWLGAVFLKVFAVLALIAAVAAWWIVLASESRLVAEEESRRQTALLMREIEAHRVTDAKLQQAKEVAESANLAKSRFVTGMSHELRTPLNSILGYAQILQKDPAIPSHRRDALGVIRRSGQHLLGLIDGLLDIAKIEAGKLRLDRGEVYLPEFLDQIVKMFRLQAEGKGLEFRFHVEGTLPEVVRADERRLRQILLNLLANAIKFTDAGTVSLSVAYRSEIAHFVVDDTGAGIARGDLERIFMPFERADSAKVSGVGGTGLGLAITRLLTGLMGGEVRVESQPGEGSRFEVRVHLPRVVAPRTTPRKEADIVGYHGGVRRILVVDDLASQRELLMNLLLPLGFEVQQAASGEACLDAVRDTPPDAVLLDIAMPGLDGWETVRRLRAAGHAKLPLILVSANAFENDADKIAGSGASEFIVKPVLVAELLAKLEWHLGVRWVYRDEARAAPARTPGLVAVPERDELQALLELGSIGHVKAIHQRLDAIERGDRRFGPFAEELRDLVRQFRLDEFSRRVRFHDERRARAA
jgi:signal transduction histidine kinase/CheY-like chemotaxis protein/purine-cytosine permease-like protein